MLSHGAERANILFANGSIRSDARHVVDYDRSLWKFPALPVEGGKRIGTDQRAHGQPVLRAAIEHFGEPVAIEPILHRCLAWIDPKTAYSGLRQFPHFLVRLRSVPIDDRDTPKDTKRFSDYIQHVGIVESVVAHLNEHHAVHTVGLGVPQDVLRRKRARLHDLRLVSFRQRVRAEVIRPDVYVSVDPIPIVGTSSE